MLALIPVNNRCLADIVEEVKKLQASIKSKRFRRKVAAIVFGNTHASTLKKCCEDLDWAMKEFDVSYSPSVQPPSFPLNRVICSM